tara:strand:+ start:212 stop:463 length:252 start_codon:yes stop_codon:yes gene_type:complete
MIVTTTEMMKAGGMLAIRILEGSDPFVNLGRIKAILKISNIRIYALSLRRPSSRVFIAVFMDGRLNFINAYSDFVKLISPVSC